MKVKIEGTRESTPCVWAYYCPETEEGCELPCRNCPADSIDEVMDKKEVIEWWENHGVEVEVL